MHDEGSRHKGAENLGTPGGEQGVAASTIGNALTAREREILKWLSQGVSDSHIARELGISPRTVSKHLENIRGKFGVSSRTAVAVAWLSQGAKFDAGKERQ